MEEAAAGEVLLLRAYEHTGFAPWTEADRAWASRAALSAVGSEAPGEQFLAARAQLALRRLEPLDPPLARWRALRPRRIEGLLVVMALGFAAGLLLDRIGSAQRINLLAPPVWALIAWNLAVYGWLGVQALFAPASAGRLRQAVVARLQRWRARGLEGEGGSTAVWKAFAADWALHGLPLNTARVALALHLGAAALALGVLAGMYLRGLVLDYRVGWESTFLDAATVRSLLSTLLAPASAASGLTVPDVAGVQALRVPAGAAPTASAAPWIHLYGLAAGAAGGVATHRAGMLGRLARAPAATAVAPVAAGALFPAPAVAAARWPHAGAGVAACRHTPDAAALAALKALFTRVFGDGFAVAGGADRGLRRRGSAGRPAGRRPARCAWRCSTWEPRPKAESQGRLMRTLALPALMLVDEGAFAQRFGAASPRRAERRGAWSALGTSLGIAVLFVHLRAADMDEAEAALQAALTPAVPGALVA